MNKETKAVIDIAEINNKLTNNLPLFIEESENKYYSQIHEVVNQISSNPKYKIILVCGPSSSGKTTTSNIVVRELEKKGQHSVCISLDDFFINRVDTPKLPNGRYDYESPRALDKDCLNEFIKNLLEKKHAFKPIYNFVRGEREEEFEEIILTDDSIVVIEGIHALNPDVITTHQDNLYKLYICPNSNFDLDGKTIIPAKSLRLMRRSLRDFYSRGHSISTTIHMWEDVLRGEELYIKPFKKLATYVVDSTHMFEPYLYANYLLPLLENIQQSETSLSMIKMLSNFDTLDKTYIPKTSLIWEFLVK